MITHGTIEYWAEQKPDALAVVDGERTLTYRAWNDAADRVASALSVRGVQAGDIVVLRTHVRLEWNILASALAKLDCSLLGLNWRLTASEVQYVLANAGASAFVCDDADPAALGLATRDKPLKVLASIDTRSTGSTSFDELLAGEPSRRYSTDDPPLIVYTSGTTGKPKGVVMGQRSKWFTAEQVLEYQKDVAQSRRSEATDPVVLVTMPMHHGAGPAQVFGALRTRRRMVLLRRFDPEVALQLIAQHRVTDWNAVPTMMKRIAALPRATLDRYDVSSIRHLSVGAAPVPYALKEWILGYFGEHCLSEGYGSTETGMVTRLPPDMQRAKPGSSGRPYRHVSIEVRGDDGAVLPVGHTGELWIRTPTTLARYLNGATLDAQTMDAKGYFNVGDVGYLDADGYLYITDRSRDLIISGGVNIYPAEVEAVLLRHPAILDVAVIGIPDDEYGEQVKAYCELKPGQPVATDELASFAARELASYKLPKSIEFVTELPRNTMGKVLKRDLRDPFWKDRERQV
jgi:long-chain acyl-CoA synthetase